MNSQEKRIAKQRVRSQLGFIAKIAPHIVRRALFMRDKKNRFIRDREWRRSLNQMIDLHRTVRRKKRILEKLQKKSGH